MQFGLMLFMPDAMLPLLLILAGACMMLGMKQTASGLFTFVIACIVLPIIMMPLVEIVPLWFLYLIMIYLVFLLPFIVISTIGSLVSPVIGKRSREEMVGTLSAWMTQIMLLLPFRLIRWTFLGIRNLWRRA